MKRSLLLCLTLLGSWHANAVLETGESIEKIVIEKQDGKEIFHVFVRRELSDKSSYEKRDYFTTELPEGYVLVEEGQLDGYKRIVVSDSFLKTAKAGVAVVGAAVTLNPFAVPAAVLACKEVYHEVPHVYSDVSDLVKGKRKNKVIAQKDQGNNEAEENKTEQEILSGKNESGNVAAGVYDKTKQVAVACKDAMPDVSKVYSGARNWVFGKKEEAVVQSEVLRHDSGENSSQ